MGGVGGRGALSWRNAIRTMGGVLVASLPFLTNFFLYLFSLKGLHSSPRRPFQRMEPEERCEATSRGLTSPSPPWKLFMCEERSIPCSPVSFIGLSFLWAFLRGADLLKTLSANPTITARVRALGWSAGLSGINLSFEMLSQPSAPPSTPPSTHPALSSFSSFVAVFQEPYLFPRLEKCLFLVVDSSKNRGQDDHQ